MAVDCKNHSRDGKDIFFYKLPHHNEQLSTKWLVNLRNPKIPQLLNHSYVCSDHFELDCFGRNIKAELLGERGKPPLVANSVPTLFQYNNFKSDSKRVLSEQRRIRKEKEETLRELLGPAYHDMKLIPPNLVTELDPVKDIDEKYKDHMFSIQSLLPGYGELAEIACQTDDHVMCETACQTTNPAASLVTTGTQWNEKDFLPDPQAIAEEHAYCKKMKFEVACQVQTLTFSDSSVTANSRKTVQKSLASKNVEKVEKKAKSKTPTVLKLKLRRRKKR